MKKKPRTKSLLPWKKIAELLYHNMGCSCCADYEMRSLAREAYTVKLEAGNNKV